MNINKINNQLQYWHNVNELPEKGKPILIDSKLIENIYLIGEFSKIDAYYQFITYGLNDGIYNDPLKNNLDKMLFKHYHDKWYDVVNRWMYLTDLKGLIE